MIKNIVITTLSIMLVASNFAWLLAPNKQKMLIHDVSQLKLDVRQRDIVIGELTGVISHQNQNKYRDEFIALFKTHPKSSEYQEFYAVMIT